MPKKKTRLDLIAQSEISEFLIFIPEFPPELSATIIKCPVTCRVCNHTWLVSGGMIQSLKKCPACVKRAKTALQFKNAKAKNLAIVEEALALRPGSKLIRELTWINNEKAQILCENDHIFEMRVRNLEISDTLNHNKNRWCHECSKEAGGKNAVKDALREGKPQEIKNQEKSIDNLKKIALSIGFEVLQSVWNETNLSFRCLVCGKITKSQWHWIYDCANGKTRRSPCSDECSRIWNLNTCNLCGNVLL